MLGTPRRTRTIAHGDATILNYVALVDASSGGAYGVVFPDAPGCTAMGATLDEALRNAGEAIAEWISDERAAGRAAPVARPVEAIRADPEVADWCLRPSVETGASVAAVVELRTPSS